MLGLNHGPLGLVRMPSMTKNSQTKTKTPDASNGILVSNGMITPAVSDAGSYFSGHQVNMSVETAVDQARSRLIVEVHIIDDDYIKEMSIEGFFDYLYKERMISMPHREGRWDRALRAAEFFAVQISDYARILDDFTHRATEGVNVALASCRLLLDLGQDQEQALEASFAVLNKIGLSLRFLIKHAHLFDDRAVQHELQRAFSTLLTLVSEIALYYHSRVATMSKKKVTLDFFSVFGRTIDQFYHQKESIADLLWSLSLRHEHLSTSLSIRTLRKWLEPGDNVLKLLASDRFASRAQRAQLTCEWFHSDLLDFTRSHDQTLSIVGAAGCGKSVLANWIEEKLRGQFGRKSYETIEFRFESDLHSECSSLACVKSLLLQLLQQNVGNAELFVSLASAYRTYMNTGEKVKLEADLWNALKTALLDYKEEKITLVIIIDGLEKVAGGDTTAPGLAQKIHKLATDFGFVRAIFLAKADYTSNLSRVKHFHIGAAQTSQDIRHMINGILNKSHSFQQLSSESQGSLQERVIDTSKGSFLWAEMVARLLLQEESPEKLHQVAEIAPKTLPELIEKLMSSVDLKDHKVKQVLGWMLVSRRPLTVSEINDLLRTDTHHKVISEQRTDVQAFLRKHYSLLTTIQSQTVVRFRHDAIRHQLYQLFIKKGFWQEMQTDLLLRLMLYSKNCFHDDEPSFDMLADRDYENTYRKNNLLEYASAYWVTHFRSTHMCHENTLELTADFKAVLPSSPAVVLFEWSRWGSYLSAREAIDLHDFCLKIRKQAFGEKHVTVFQTLAVVGLIQHSCGRHIEAGQTIFKAHQLALTVFKQYGILNMKCAHVFLSCVESLTYSSRTEIVTCKETIIKYLVAGYKHVEGEQSRMVIYYMKLLIELYIQIGDEKAALIIYEELREIILRYHGGHSDELAGAEELMITLKKGGEKDIVAWEGGSLFELYDEETEVTTIEEIQLTLELVLKYETKGDIFAAEELLLRLWGRVIAMCSHHASVEWRIAKIEVAIAYVRFLLRLKKHDEAHSILICLWAEYEHEHFDSELIFINLKVIGELMRTCGLFSVAISVFQKVWQYFQRTQKTHHEVCQLTTILLSETVEEFVTLEETTTETTVITTTETSETSTSTKVTRKSETIVREVFEHHCSSSTSFHFESIIKSCSALLSIFIKEERWSEAITHINTTLEIVWRVMITGIGMICLPETCISEAISIAIHLANCYVKEHRFEEAEKIYIRIYQACLFSCKVNDEHVTKAFNYLITFYESHHRHEKTIEVYADYIHCHRRELGAHHSVSIKLLYIFADLLWRYGYHRCYEYYLEIFTVLNKESHICHYDAMDAAIMIMKHYHHEQRWSELQHICEILWATLVHHHHKEKFTVDIIRSIYSSYSIILEKHVKAEFSLQHKIAFQYKETCEKYFGMSSEITIESFVTFATVCERHESYYEEAITVFEKVMKWSESSSKTTTTTTISTHVKAARTRLTKLYVKVITSSETSVSTTRIERAISLTIERYTEIKVQFGFHHHETIICLRDVLLLYKRKNSRTQMIQMLQDLVLDLVCHEKDSWRLHHAAIAIGKLYLEFGLVEVGLSFHDNLKGLILAVGTEHKCDFTLKHHYGRLSYIFLVTFEMTLRQYTAIHYSEIMVSLLTEYMLFQQFTRIKTSKVKIEIKLVHAARLRHFLYIHKRYHQCEMVERQCFEIFMATYSSSFKASREATFAFFVVLLQHIGETNKELVNLSLSSCIAGITKVESLIKAGEFQKAFDMANCVYQFTSSVHAYRDLKHVGWGFRLCQCLAGESVNKLKDEKLRQQMLQLSKTVVEHILDACKNNGVDFVGLSLSDLQALVALLGAQHHYQSLEWLLERLWTSREAQKVWSQDHVLGTGRSLVHAKFAHGHQTKAIDFCEDICYNLRRARGSTDPTTMAFSGLLAEMLTSTKRYGEAIQVHLDLLRLIVEGGDNDDYDPDDADEEISFKTAQKHSQLIKACYQRLGAWDVRESSVKAIISKLRSKYPKIDISAAEKWDVTKKLKPEDEKLGLWQEPKTWTLIMDIMGSNKRHEPKQQVKRARSSFYGREMGRKSLQLPNGDGGVGHKQGLAPQSEIMMTEALRETVAAA